MDALSEHLQPYKDLVGMSAAAITILQFFSGSLVLKDIRKRGGTEGFSAAPFLCGLVFCLLNIQFGIMIRDSAMVKVNFIGLALNIIYVILFYVYTTGRRKMKVWAQIGLAGAIATGIYAYTLYEDVKHLEFRFGMILSVILFVLVGMPLLGLKEIMRKKSTEGLPFPIIFSGSLVSISWLLYGIIINNKFVAAQNLIAFILGSIQLSLFVIYPSTSVGKVATKDKKEKKEKKDKKEKKEN